MTEIFKFKVTNAQFKTINILNELGGWSTHNQIFKHGGFSNSANALVKHEYVEVREIIDVKGYKFLEWRSTYRNVCYPLIVTNTK